MIWPLHQAQSVGFSLQWHLDEVVIPIDGENYWLWRAVYVNGILLDKLVQKQ
ncbi:DDE-type integrase/transposase/recombinase [Ruegeria sp. ANG10]|uniref:DDE-type integrase/transposase/recombinase n=1 Tax=Ruegeria sp. ANG10 TaxID=3042467 RepID=UPI00345283B5